MKKLMLTLMGVGLAATAAIVMIKWQSNPPPPVETAVQPAGTPAPSVNPPPTIPVAKANAPEPAEEHHNVTESTVELAQVSNVAAPPRIAAPAEPAARPGVAATFSQPLQTLVSPQANFAQKQAAWKQLRDSHQLDQVITDLELAAKEDPSAAKYPAVLGQAYLQKLMETQDIRDRAILAMKADQSFDQALNLDPSNWEARFWKASTLSHWPAELNKSEEVMQNLVTLVEQQEAQSPQPHFAQTYVLLGEQYQKAGYQDDAKQMWQRGARLFPDNSALRDKLANLP